MEPRNRDGRSGQGADGKAAVSSRAGTVATAVVFFLAAWLVVDGIAGDRGLIANRRRRAELAIQQESLNRLKWENERRLDLIRRLQAQDPATFENFARRQRGFIRPGEKVFVVRDAPKVR
jgi:cell division protein FtsB